MRNGKVLEDSVAVVRTEVITETECRGYKKNRPRPAGDIRTKIHQGTSTCSVLHGHINCMSNCTRVTNRILDELQRIVG